MHAGADRPALDSPSRGELKPVIANLNPNPKSKGVCALNARSALSYKE